MIVKVQWPLFPPDGELLIYTRNRSTSWMTRQDRFDPETLSMIRADCSNTGKAFYQASISGDGHLKIGQRVEDQGW